MGDTPLVPVPSDFATDVKGSTPVPDDSASQHSETAHDFITSQLQLEADAREALPYSFSHCTQPLGALKQNLFACLTCNPPDSSSFQPAAVCYSCSISCHGEHTLVELFNRRNFTCDCGTTRMPDESPCTLRIDPITGLKNSMRGEKASEGNTYNQNCKNRFCGCGEIYDAHQEKGTMFQCLGLAQEKDGGCGEDWWHPECVVGLGRKEWAEQQPKKGTKPIATDGGNAEAANNEDDGDAPLPPGFPPEDDFEAFICYKCVDAHPWIKAYAGTEGFLPAVYHKSPSVQNGHHEANESTSPSHALPSAPNLEPATNSDAAPSKTPSSPKKRTATEADLDFSLDNDTTSSVSKHPKPSTITSPAATTTTNNDTANNASPTPPHHTTLPPPSPHSLSLFLHPEFRSYLCRCLNCYFLLRPHPVLLEEEPIYEPPLSSSTNNSSPNSPNGSQRSLLERGEAALSNIDRVRAIEGVMVYNHLKEKVKTFLQPFAESGQAVGAEDIKAYFEGLRGDEAGKMAGGGNGDGGGGGGQEEGDQRREQGGY